MSEAAAYLRVAESQVQRLAEMRVLPGRQIGGEWRFLKVGLQDWLREPDPGSGNEAFLALAGVSARRSRHRVNRPRGPSATRPNQCRVRAMILLDTDMLTLLLQGSRVSKNAYALRRPTLPRPSLPGWK